MLINTTGVLALYEYLYGQCIRGYPMADKYKLISNRSARPELIVIALLNIRWLANKNIWHSNWLALCKMLSYIWHLQTKRITLSLPPSRIHPSSSLPPSPPSSAPCSLLHGSAKASFASRSFREPKRYNIWRIFFTTWLPQSMIEFQRRTKTCFIILASPTHSSQFLFHPLKQHLDYLKR